MRILILTLCVFLLLSGVRLFMENIGRMLSGRCCGGCEGCREQKNCSSFKRRG